MTIAVATSTSNKQTVQHSVPVVILGADTVLAALPATAVQLAHACIEAGFVNVIPASWGDELIAAATLRRLPEFGNGPVIQCSCPIVAHRLLSVSGDLRPVLLPLVPPPVALARYVHALSQPNRARVTYVGGCPGAIDDSIDIRMSADALFSMLAERGISLDEQPRVFESFVPADRRRFRSQAGGLPAAEVLWADYGSRSLVEVEGDDLAAEVAQHVLGGRNVLIDAAVKLGCVCSGATARRTTKDPRAFLASLEPPRASAPVVDENTPIELDLPVPAASRTPIDVMAVPSSQYATPPRGADLATGSSLSPPRGVAAVSELRQAPRNPSPAARPVGGSSPVVRPADGKEGKTLPRAYVARRRLSPRSTPVVPAEPLAADAMRARQEMQDEDPVERIYSVELIELEAPAEPDPLDAPLADPPKSEEAAKAQDDVALAANPEIEEIEAEPVEVRTPVSVRFSEPASFQAMSAAEPAMETLSSAEPRSDRPPVREPEEQLDVAIPLSHWTEPPAPQLKNSETPDLHWASGNGDDSAAHRAAESADVADIGTPNRDLPPTQSFSRVDEVVVQPQPQPLPVPAAQPPLNTRNIVLFLLAAVALAAAVSATLVILAERQFAPRATTTTSTDH